MLGAIVNIDGSQEMLYKVVQLSWKRGVIGFWSTGEFSVIIGLWSLGFNNIALNLKNDFALFVWNTVADMIRCTLLLKVQERTFLPFWLWLTLHFDPFTLTQWHAYAWL